VVNDPSDGNQRTVANHLGIQAAGRGAGRIVRIRSRRGHGSRRYQLDTGRHTAT
jgi:hypothetical protein